MTKPKRVILTGGPGAEKTSILDVLAEDGFRIGQDVVREIIRERLAAGLSPRPSPKRSTRNRSNAIWSPIVKRPRHWTQ